MHLGHCPRNMLSTLFRLVAASHLAFTVSPSELSASSRSPYLMLSFYVCCRWLILNLMVSAHGSASP